MFNMTEETAKADVPERDDLDFSRSEQEGNKINVTFEKYLDSYN